MILAHGTEIVIESDD